MKKFAWVVAFLISIWAINSKNSSTRYREREIITYDPYAHVREPYYSDYYNDRCGCPYDLDQRGNSCGARSAWSKTGGAEPICFLGDQR
jgi:hypothetical protein